MALCGTGKFRQNATVSTDHEVGDDGKKYDGENPLRHDVTEQLGEEVSRRSVITTHRFVSAFSKQYKHRLHRMYE